MHEKTFSERLKRILPFLLILTSILGAIHYFIFCVAARSLADTDPRRLGLFSIFALGLFLMPGGLLLSMGPWRKKLYVITMVGYLWMGFFPIVWFFSLVELFSNLVWPHEYSLWILPAAFLISLWALFNGLRAPRVFRHDIQGPAFLKDVRIVQISDLHVGMYFLKQKWLQSVVDQIQNLKPDLVAVTGDLTDGAYDEVAPMLEPLSQLNPLLGKFYITGNHEYIREGQWERRLEQLDFQVLHNSNRVIERGAGKLLVAGVPDRSVGRFHQGLRSDPDTALTVDKEVDYRILLAHQPLSVFEVQKEKCDLILSGHTHGGQIFPFRFFVRLQQPVVSGFKKINGILVFAHQGTGHWGPPMRWFTRSEIVVFRYVT